MTDGQRVADIAEQFGLSAMPSCVLLVLLESEGRILAMDTIADRVRDLMGDYPTKASIATSLKWARKAIYGGGFWIESIYGIGVRINRFPTAKTRCSAR